MKRSRLYLGLTTAVLAVAGVIAAKATKFGPTVTAFVYTVSGTHCTAVQTNCQFDANGLKTCKALGSSTIYTSRTTNQTECRTILKYNVD